MTKILIVEDDAPQRNILCDALENLGYEVLSAKDGSEGLKLALLEHPDVITTDVVMPNMNGREMIRQLRNDDWGKSVQVIYLTNSEYTPGEICNICPDDYTCCLIKVNITIKTIVSKIKAVVDA